MSESCCYSDKSFHAFVQRQRQEAALNQDTTDFPSQQTSQPTRRGLLSKKLKTPKTAENGYASRSRKANSTKQGSKLPRENVSTATRTGGVPCADGVDEATINPLTKTVLNLGCHLLGKRGSWVCLEPVQEAATAVFGCFLEW